MNEVVEAGACVSEVVPRPVETGADTGGAVTVEVDREGRFGQGWQRVIDELIDWASNPEQFADEGIDAPSRETLRLAGKLALELRDNGLPSPDRIVPDPNGGLVFEYDTAQGASEYHIWDDGSIDFCMFDDTRLVSRHILF